MISLERSLNSNINNNDKPFNEHDNFEKFGVPTLDLPTVNDVS